LRRALDGQFAAALMQCTDAGLVASSDGVQALLARAMVQGLAIRGSCIKNDRNVLFMKLKPPNSK
jgi:hypothetical protein